jgi:uncharacterized membrane protein
MIGGYQARIAEFFIWAFFLLVLVPTTTMATVKFGEPLRPVLFFAIIAGGLFASAILIFFDRWEGDSKDRERDLKIVRIRRGLDV